MDLFGLFHTINWISSLLCNTCGGFHIIIQVSVSFSSLLQFCSFSGIWHLAGDLLILDLRSSQSACFPMPGKVSLWIFM